MSDERRNNFRAECTKPATLELPKRALPLPCTVVNLSDSGARIAGVKAASLPDAFSLRLGPGRKGLRACQVAWRLPDEVGVSFVDRPAGEETPAPRHKAVPAT